MQKIEVDQQIQKLLSKNKMKLGYQFDFPRYKEIPDEVKLALSVLQTHGLNVKVILVLE